MVSLHQARSCCRSGAGSPSSGDGWPRVRCLTAGSAPEERLTNPPVIYTGGTSAKRTQVLCGFFFFSSRKERDIHFSQAGNLTKRLCLLEGAEEGSAAGRAVATACFEPSLLRDACQALPLPWARGVAQRWFHSARHLHSSWQDAWKDVCIPTTCPGLVMVGCRAGLPREVVEPPSPEVLRGVGMWHRGTRLVVGLRRLG